jgi:1,4-alpha-glucan branching enzyme
MLFQGEEWAASTPFAFFTSHPEQELGHAVSEGRKREFEKMAWDTETILDPQDPATFAASKLDWSEVADGRHAVVLEAYRSLAALRRALPELTDPDMTRHSCEYDENARWLMVRRGGAEGSVVAVNFSDVEVRVSLGDGSSGRTWTALWQSPAGVDVRGDELVLPPRASCLLR